MKRENTETTEPEITFDEVQEAAIQARILKDREREHEAIAGDRAYRIAIAACIQSARSGMDDEEIVHFMQRQWDKFVKENPILGKKVEKAKPAPG